MPSLRGGSGEPLGVHLLPATDVRDVVLQLLRHIRVRVRLEGRGHPRGNLLVQRLHVPAVGAGPRSRAAGTADRVRRAAHRPRRRNHTARARDRRRHNRRRCLRRVGGLRGGGRRGGGGEEEPLEDLHLLGQRLNRRAVLGRLLRSLGRLLRLGLLGRRAQLDDLRLSRSVPGAEALHLRTVLARGRLLPFELRPQRA